MKRQSHAMRARMTDVPQSKLYDLTAPELEAEIHARAEELLASIFRQGDHSRHRYVGLIGAIAYASLSIDVAHQLHAMLIDEAVDLLDRGFVGHVENRLIEAIGVYIGDARRETRWDDFQRASGVKEDAA